MILEEAIFYLFINIVRVYIIYRFFGLFFEPDSKRPQALFLYVLFYILNSVAYLWIHVDIINLLVNMGGLMLITLIGYKGSFAKKFLSVILNLGIGVLSENLAWVLFVRGKNGHAENYGNFFFVLMLLFLEVLIEKTFKLRKGIEIASYKNIPLVLIPIGSLFVANTLIEGNCEKTFLVAVSLCVLLIINLSALYLYEKILDDCVNQKDKEMYRMQVIMYQNQLDIMRNTNHTYRTMRHDMKHHMGMIADYIQDNEKEKALQYLGKMSNHLRGGNKYIDTSNSSIDSIFNYIIDEVHKIGGHIRLDVKIFEKIPVDDFDINVILSNLLLNACEAIQKCDKKEINVTMKYDRGILLISIQNTYNGMIREKFGKFLTTKENKDIHGIGLHSVAEVIERYNGDIKIKYDAEKFRVNVLLYILDSSMVLAT